MEMRLREDEIECMKKFVTWLICYRREGREGLRGFKK